MIGEQRSALFEDLVREWDGEQLATRFIRASETWMLVCVHSTVAGPAAGGTRMKVYSRPTDALLDGLQLSGAMTRKNAVAGLPLGGGKGVLAVSEMPTGQQRRELLLQYADLISSLGGTYRTACDMNTSEADMEIIAERCPFAFGRSVTHGGSGSSAPATATGVFYGIVASVAHVFETSMLRGTTVLVQGVGAVGRALAMQLHHAGARLILADINASRAREVASEIGATVIAPDDAIMTECDVFSPCASGGVFSAETIPLLRCRIVAGAANNQLIQPSVGDLFKERGVLYAPDFVVNAGGIIHLASLELLGEDQARLDERIRGIGETLMLVYSMADVGGISTTKAAERMAAERISLIRRRKAVQRSNPES